MNFIYALTQIDFFGDYLATSDIQGDSFVVETAIYDILCYFHGLNL